jgi:hypothetical protein
VSSATKVYVPGANRLRDRWSEYSVSVTVTFVPLGCPLELALLLGFVPEPELFEHAVAASSPPAVSRTVSTMVDPAVRTFMGVSLPGTA